MLRQAGTELSLVWVGHVRITASAAALCSFNELLNKLVHLFTHDAITGITDQCFATVLRSSRKSRLFSIIG